MLQGLFSSPSMELFSAVDNNLAASQLWSYGNHTDSNYQAAAMEAILSQASLGLMSTSDYQVMAQYYGILHHPTILEGMDETQVNLPSSSCVNTGISSNSATTISSSLGLDHKPINIYSKQSASANNMILSFPPDVFKGQASICAKRRSWNEALSSPDPRGNHRMSDTVVSSNIEGGPHVIYPVNDSKASIASLAYPCTIVGSTQEEEEPPYPNMNMKAYMKPMLGNRESGGSPKWQEGLQISSNQRQFSKSSNVDMESTKDVMGTHQQAPPLGKDDGPIYTGINDPCHLSLYKEEALHQYQPNMIEKEASVALASTQSFPSTNQHAPRKRPAAAAHLPSPSASYSKRAHLQNVKGVMGMVSTLTSGTTTTTTTKSSKSSTRNPLGPALNTNGRPRAQQGSANDPQSIAARNRRERINARLKVLQELVPNGSKVDLVTMLEKAINYVKYLQLQLRVLSNDDLWQASQDDLSEQAADTVAAKSEEGYNSRHNKMDENNMQSLATCSDNSETHYKYSMGDKVYNP